MSSSQMSLREKFSYGVGHILNDLSASMWFSYLLIYLHKVVIFENTVSGYMMLLGFYQKIDSLNSTSFDSLIIFLGQVADAIATIFVGFESDRTRTGFFNYGRRKSWHLVGKCFFIITNLNSRLCYLLIFDCLRCDWCLNFVSVHV